MPHSVIETVTRRIAERSQDLRADYVARMEQAAEVFPQRGALACGNLAHGFAACGGEDKLRLKNTERDSSAPNIGIVTAYNDMLSAHQPYEPYPEMIREAAHLEGATAQVAGGVPAMCDGVTQGQPGMELSLFSRDVIAASTAIALSHHMFDAALCLGICDKIVPGLLIGALSFGHLPTVFVPAGPMPSGLPNKEKARIRQLFAEGKVGRDELLEAESQSYHSAGTCTFYGTANSNQMLMEMMGLQLPGSSFVNPGTPLRDALTRAAVQQALRLTKQSDRYTPLYRVLDEKALVNGVIGLLATGGSTNHTLHLIAIARAAGFILNWDDFSALSDVVPLLCRIYPNGQADVNHFHAAGGMGFLVRTLLESGLLHEDVTTIAGDGMHHYADEPFLSQAHQAEWREAPSTSGDTDILRSAGEPFSAHGGLSLLEGNLGRSVIKVSAVAPEHRRVQAPAKVFNSQDEMQAAFKAGELHGDFVAVIRYQGPRANGMPELHKLTPALGVLQDMGFQVALVTDGRMSGASGKVPAAIHVSPECLDGGPLANVRDGDMILLDAENGILEAQVDAAEFNARTPETPDLTNSHFGTGRELFATMRGAAGPAEEGASFLFPALRTTKGEKQAA